MKTEHLDALTRSLAGSFAFCGIAVAQGGARQFSLACAPGIKADKDTMFRVASISKLVVGQAVAAFVKANATGWGTDVSDILGWSMRNPDYPDVPVTLGMVASHSAGLTDDAGYVLPSQTSLEEWCTTRQVFACQPSVYFDYANLGYVILAEVLERMSGMSFTKAVVPHLPQSAGFTWQGVTPAQAANRLPTYRSGAAGFEAQIDEDIVAPGPSRNAGVFSPQGGLRTSLAGLLELAEGLRHADRIELWTPLMGRGNYLDGVFECYGSGLQIYYQPRFYPHELIGHFGKAYGFSGGVWYDVKAKTSFAYALNGLPIGDESDAFSVAESKIFEAVAGI